ncbi:hypothetical protein ACFLV4_01910 [Chloroflexota bacterium]
MAIEAGGSRYGLYALWEDEGLESQRLSVTLDHGYGPAKAWIDEARSAISANSRQCGLPGKTRCPG